MRTWQRLEPRTRDETMKAGLRAQVHDPLWLLTRQWQWGEFAGEDAGSPISARLLLESNRLTRVREGRSSGQPAKPYDPGIAPLETAVEAETATALESQAGGATRRSAEAGLSLARMLEQAGLHVRDNLLSRFPIPQPSAAGDLSNRDIRYLSVMGGRAPNGSHIRHALVEAEGTGSVVDLLDSIAIEEAARETAAGILQEWKGWYDGLPPDPGAPSAAPAWVSERLEYTFATAAPEGAEASPALPRFTGTRTEDPAVERLVAELNRPHLNPEGVALTNAGRASTSDSAARPTETVLSAPAYGGERLEWYSFERTADATSLGATRDGRQPWKVQTLLPTPIHFPGLPLSRWWSFEDAAVDLGALHVAPEDLARLVFAEFILSYGNDWFLVPVELRAGSITRLHSVRVMNTFGEVTGIRPVSQVTPDAPWRMYELSGASAAPAPFFLAPALPPHLEGEPIEEVRLLRDEMANLAWAVELMAPSPVTGLPINRYEQYQRKRAEEEEVAEERPAAFAPVRYRLGTPVPDYWVPLVPRQRSDERRSIYLERGSLLNTEQGHLGEALGALLKELRRLYEEEVPRAGVRVTRTHQLSRWSDGSTHLWLGRKKRIGRGEGSSGLRYDLVEPADAQAEGTPPEGAPTGRVSLRDVAGYVEGLELSPQFSLQQWAQQFVAHSEASEGLASDNRWSVWQLIRRTGKER